MTHERFMKFAEAELKRSCEEAVAPAVAPAVPPVGRRVPKACPRCPQAKPPPPTPTWCDHAAVPPPPTHAVAAIEAAVAQPVPFMAGGPHPAQVPRPVPFKAGGLLMVPENHEAPPPKPKRPPPTLHENHGRGRPTIAVVATIPLNLVTTIAVATPPPPHQPHQPVPLDSDTSAAVAAAPVSPHLSPSLNTRFTREWFEMVRYTVGNMPRRSIHNEALKYFRHCGENPPGVPHTPAYNMMTSDLSFSWADRASCLHYIQIPTIERNGPTPMSFSFSDTKREEWSWQLMVLALNKASMDDLLPADTGVSIVTVLCLPRQNSYDVARHTCAKEEAKKGAGNCFQKPDGTMVTAPKWEFLFKRSDGTGIRMSPQNTKSVVNLWHMSDDNDVMVALPTRGPGTSDGPGTFRHFQRAAKLPEVYHFGADHAPKLARSVAAGTPTALQPYTRDNLQPRP